MLSKTVTQGQRVSLKRSREDTTIEELSKSNAQSLDDIFVPKTCVSYYMCTRPCPRLEYCELIKTILTCCDDGSKYDKIVFCLCGHCHSDCDSTFVFSSSINSPNKDVTEALCWLILGAAKTDGYDFDYLDIDTRQLETFLMYIGWQG
jgi:hypothetical protein